MSATVIHWLVAGLLVLHGIAHLVGFVAPWRLMDLENVPYKTTVLGGTIDLGDKGIRFLGILWLIVAMAFAAAAMGLLIGERWWSPLALIICIVSLAVCVVEWPETRIGVAVNLLILAVLLIAPRLGWLPEAA